MSSHANTSRSSLDIEDFIRYEITQRNLAQFVGKASLNILDIGGGSAIDAVWLAEKGHTITVIEPDSEAVHDGNLFDMVLCHCVAMYQPNPNQFVRGAIGKARRGGIVSILEKNYLGADQRLRKNGDVTVLNDFRKSHRYVNHVNKNVYAFMGEELEKTIESTGATILQHRGVRAIYDTDRRLAEDVPLQERQKMLDDESMYGKIESLQTNAQLHHFVARAA